MNTNPIQSALGYSIHSGLTEGCHERITWNALVLALPNLTPSSQIQIPQSEVWRKVADRLVSNTRLQEVFVPNVTDQNTEDQLRLVLVSLLIGVRSPDTEGHAVTNFNSLRQIHADPSAEGQYAHALRGPYDDGPEGDEVAVLGVRAEIKRLLDSVLKIIRETPPEDQVVTVQLYFDFYGLVSIEVWEPAYLIGRMLHALQDSFAHTIRSDDLKRIIHVLNYVDAISGDLKESVDGLPHSDFMDRCDGDTAPIADTAMRVSALLIESINQMLVTRDDRILKEMLDEWVTYEPGCTVINDYCGSLWVEFARQEPTGPYLEEFIGCQFMNRSVGRAVNRPLSALWGGHLAIVWPLLVLLGALWSRRRTLKRAQVRAQVIAQERLSPRSLYLLLWGVIFVGSALMSEVRAQTFIQAETHASVLSDTPDRSVLASTYGWGARGGYTWDAWMALIHIEQNVWLSTELTNKTTSGVLNVGFGGAYLYGGEFVRTSLVVGTSTLLFDTLFNQRGTTGLFIDLRPLELCWRPRSWLALNLTPLSFTYVSPVLESPPIKMVLYRTVFGVEVRL